MKKWFITILIILILSQLVLSIDICEDYLENEKECQMTTPSITCSNYTYDILAANGTIIQEGNLTLLNQSIYYFNFSESNGDYLIRLCNGATREIYVGGKDKMILAIITLIPLIFGLFMLIGATTLSQEHNVLRIVLFLMSPITVWVSFHFGMISLIYTHGLTELQDAIGSTTYWMGWFFFVMVSYFIIYSIWKAFNSMAQQKEDKLNY